MDEAQRTAPGSEAEQLLADVLQSDVLSVVEVTRPRETPDLVVRFRDGDTVALEVKEAAHPSPDQIGKLVGRSHPGKQSLPVLVADVISEPGRRMLADAGWGFFDRRGRLYLPASGRQVEVDVPARARGGRPRTGVRGASGIVVAFAALLGADRPDGLGVRELARASGLKSPTSVTNARQALMGANLLEPDGRPVVPDLFWALAGHWSQPVHGLAQAPSTRLVAELGHNINGPYCERLSDLTGPGVDPTVFEGVAVGGDLAAELYGAPIVRTRKSPFDLYVPGAVVISRLKRRYGEAAHLTERAAGVRSFPMSLAARLRVPPRSGSHGFPLAHPLVVALDLAQDPARGREILADFAPEGVKRVW